jgi:hypothetical protein
VGAARDQRPGAVQQPAGRDRVTAVRRRQCGRTDERTRLSACTFLGAQPGLPGGFEVAAEVRDHRVDAGSAAHCGAAGVGIGGRDRLVGTKAGSVEVTDQPRRLGRRGQDRRPIGVPDEGRVIGELDRPPPDLLQVPPGHHPVDGERDRHARFDRRPVAGRPEVVHLRPQPPVRLRLVGAEHPRTDVLGDRTTSFDEPRVRLVGLTQTVDLVHEKPAHGEEEPVARALGVRDQQGRVDQTVQEVEGVAGQPRSEHLHRLEVDSADERGDRAQQVLLVRREQPVRRLDGRAQGALPLVLGALPPGREVEGTVEAFAHCTQRHHRHLPGRQLDPERQAVQPPQHFHQVRNVALVDLEVAPLSARVLDERADAALPPQGRQVRHASRHRQRLQSDDVLTRCVQRHPRRREHPHPGCRPPQRDDELAARLDHVLAVVQDEQQVAVGQSGGDLGRAGVPGEEQPEAGNHGLTDVVGTVDTRERDHHCFTELGQPGRDVERQAGLADAARPGQGDDAVGAEQPRDLLPVVLPAHHRTVRLRHPSCDDGALHEAGGHLLLQVAECVGGIEPGLVDQPSPEGLGGVHRLRCAAVGRERSHVQQGRALPQGRRRSGDGRVDDHAGVAP